MPDFWEFPTVSMGLGPITALYHARFNRYLQNRHVDDTSGSRVWAFLGDGECDEPETLGRDLRSPREQLDNLVFVVNCNLQRLDGPVRGNGKVIQELEATFRGAGWNVIKVIWGSKWDDLLAQDKKDGVLLNQMNTTVDGEFQRYAIEDGAYIRDNFFGPDERLRQMVAHLSDDELLSLPAVATTTASSTRPTRRRPRTSARGVRPSSCARRSRDGRSARDSRSRNSTHQIKKMTKDQIIAIHDRLHLEDVIPDEGLDAEHPPYITLAKDSIEYQYMMERRKALDGSIPAHHRRPPTARPPRRRPLRRGPGRLQRAGGVDDDGVHTTAPRTRP